LYIDNLFLIQAQKIVPDDQWESFMYDLREPFPASFRISGYRNQGKAILKTMEGEYFKALTEEQAKPECLTWYPEDLAWLLSLTRKDTRKSEANVKLHNFLVSETEAGNISRQGTYFTNLYIYIYMFKSDVENSQF
jgi:tRNA (cytosine34-C5)-methyltransferase